MRKYLLAILSCLAISFTQAQDINDAVLFSSEDLMGTARYKSMSGAFGALGGDLSAMNINPASSAVFNRSYGTFTLGYRNSNNDVNFLNGFTSEKNSLLDFTQGGAALVFINADESSKWGKFSIGFNYNQQNNFSDEFIARGTNSNSIDNYFLDHAQGVPLDLLETLPNESITELYSYLGQTQGYGAQQAMLGYQSYILNAVDDEDPANTAYTSSVGPGNFEQDYTYLATGLNGKFSFNVATEYDDRFYLGLNLNSHFINYEKYTNLYEENNNVGSETNVVEFQNTLNTLGSGFSFQLGGIAKLTDYLRLGVSYQSPTWYNMEEETTQSVGTYSQELNETVIIRPDVVNIFPEYKITTPAKYTGSLAFVFADRGLISVDYSFRNFSNTKFRPKKDPVFVAENQRMKDMLQGASSVRIGGEYKIKDLSLRAGYRFEESPYEDENLMSNLNGYSVGLGYDFGGMKLDVAYDAAQQERQHQLYAVGLTNRANIDSKISNVTLSLSFRL